MQPSSLCAFLCLVGLCSAGSLFLKPRNRDRYDNPIPVVLAAPVGSVICIKDICDPNICAMIHAEGRINMTSGDDAVRGGQCFRATKPTLEFSAMLASGCCSFSGVVTKEVGGEAILKETVMFHVDFVDSAAKELGLAVPEAQVEWGRLKIREGVHSTNWIGECPLIQEARSLAKISRGLHLEFGTGSGDTTRCMARALPDEGMRVPKIHTFDSFEGLLEDWRPGFPKGRWSNKGVPQKFFPQDNVIVYPGLFGDTLPAFARSHLSFYPVTFVLLDVGPMEPARFVMRQVACALRVGSVILSANYYNFRNWTTFGSESDALREVFEQYGVNVELVSRWGTWMTLRVTKQALKLKCLGSSAAEIVQELEENEGSYDAAVAAEKKVRNLLERDSKSPYANWILPVVLTLQRHSLSALPEILNTTRRLVSLVRVPHEPSEQDDPVRWLDELQMPYMGGETPFDLSVPLSRLHHDADQMRYLIEQGHTDPKIRLYLEGLDGILKEHESENRSRAQAVKLEWDQWTSIGRYFNRALYIPVAPRVAHAVNPNLDFAKIEQDYLGASPHVVVVDDFLTDDALEGLSRYFREATVFWDSSHPTYTGSYLTEAFLSDLGVQLVQEVGLRFPNIICDHHLNQAWVYKYDDHAERAINIHADMAAVNFNLWLSPDENALDEGRGSGLIVYEKVPPADWRMNIFNADPTPAPVKLLLKESSKRVIHHKRNRLVLFQSDLFHASGTEMKWKPGYAGRRINLTLLFGKMRAQCGDNTRRRNAAKEDL